MAHHPKTDASSIDLEALKRRLARGDHLPVEGRVVGLVGTALHAVAPGTRAGDLVVVTRRDAPPLDAEVIGFDDERALLMPLGDIAGVALDDCVRSTGAPLRITAGEGLLGRVLDGLGRPCDGAGPVTGDVVSWSVDRSPPAALSRKRVSTPFPMGVRVLDAAMTMAVGQRVGLFASAGVGKSLLLGQIGRQCAADVVVIALVGERGREVVEFLEDALGPAGRSRACVVVATADAPAMVRVRAASVATSIAEFFRDRGANVLLLFDSLTRVARAQREVGLAAGEPPARRAFPPSVFALLPRLIERAGPSSLGAITAVYTVLGESGELDDPVAEEARAALDGHVVLDRSLAARGHWPAVDVSRSLSRVMDRVVTPEHRAAATRLRALLAAFEGRRDLIALGGYVRGSESLTDEAIARMPAIEAFLRQRPDEAADFSDTVRRLVSIVN